VITSKLVHERVSDMVHVRMSKRDRDRLARDLRLLMAEARYRENMTARDCKAYEATMKRTDSLVTALLEGT
jgi:hypothetical protein